MENSSRYSNRTSQPQSSARKQRRSGYEPSDTETEWHETPWHDFNLRNGDPGLEGPNLASDQARNPSPLKLSWRHSARFEDELSLARRRHSKSPYNPRRDDGNFRSPTPVSDFRSNFNPLSPKPALDSKKNVSHYSKSEGGRHISPHEPVREGHESVNNETVSSNRKQNYRQVHKNVGDVERGGHSQVNEISRASEKSNYSRRSLSAPRPRSREMDQQKKYGHTEENGDRTPSPLPRNMPQKERESSHRNDPSVGELNEMIANAKISRIQNTDAPNFQSTESISPGDIFFSRDYADLTMTMQKIVFPKNGGVESRFGPKPPLLTGRDFVPHQRSEVNGNFAHNNQGNSSSTVLRRTTTTSGSALSGQSSDKFSTSSSKLSGTSGSTENFVASRKKSQTETWFFCIKKGSCRTSKSPRKK